MADFFRLNLPYGISRNEKGEWRAFNREYAPLGFSKTEENRFGLDYLGLPVYSKYRKISNRTLIGLAGGEKHLRRNQEGEIVEVFLYDQDSNPKTRSGIDKELWDQYSKKLQILAKFETEVDLPL